VCPTLVAGGEDDYFYPPDLFRETAQGIAYVRLCLYPNVAHPAVKENVLRFLREEA